MSGRTPYEKTIDKIWREHDRKLNVVAAKIRRELVVPLCRRHGLVFRARVPSGFAPFTFVTAGDVEITDEARAEMQGYGRAEFERVFRVLNTFISSGDVIGSRVADVPFGAETKPRKRAPRRKRAK